MVDVVRDGGSPRTAVVVGAGVVGLSTAWFLQERGVEVTVVDRVGVAAGASHGNAGWLSPGLAIPLNEPGVLRYGLRSLFAPEAPLHVPATLDPGLWRFLLRFAAHCRWSAWERAALGGAPLNDDCLDAFDTLAAGGVPAPANPAPITALFESSGQAAGLLGELARLARLGQPVAHTSLTRDEIRELCPQAGDGVAAGVRLDGQRYVDPAAFVASLAEAVRGRGGSVQGGFDVTAVRPNRHATSVVSATGGVVSADVVVLATGAWLSHLAHPLGVRTPVLAGRGYSFTVPTDEPVPAPVYLPTVRVACTPYRGGLRVAGTMEFRGPDAALDPRRIDAIAASARPLLNGVRWDELTDSWVGPRPVTHDGLPLIGAAGHPGIYVAGGHGMWGFTQGPVTGRLLAEQIVTGKQPEALRPVDPLR